MTHFIFSRVCYLSDKMLTIQDGQEIETYQFWFCYCKIKTLVAAEVN